MDTKIFIARTGAKKISVVTEKYPYAVAYLRRDEVLNVIKRHINDEIIHFGSANCSALDEMKALLKKFRAI